MAGEEQKFIYNVFKRRVETNQKWLRCPIEITYYQRFMNYYHLIVVIRV